MRAFEELVVIIAAVVLLLGLAAVISGTLCVIERLRLRLQQWRATRQARTRYHAVGWIDLPPVPEPGA